MPSCPTASVAILFFFLLRHEPLLSGSEIIRRRCLSVVFHLLSSISSLNRGTMMLLCSTLLSKKELQLIDETRFVFVGTLIALQILSNSIQNQTILQKQPTTQELLPTSINQKELFIKK